MQRIPALTKSVAGTGKDTERSGYRQEIDHHSSMGAGLCMDTCPDTTDADMDTDMDTDCQISCDREASCYTESFCTSCDAIASLGCRYRRHRRQCPASPAAQVQANEAPSPSC